jgi:CCR4-NOT transcriptional regulation complex NOT5 subunit
VWAVANNNTLNIYATPNTSGVEKPLHSFDFKVGAVSVAATSTLATTTTSSVAGSTPVTPPVATIPDDNLSLDDSHDSKDVASTETPAPSMTRDQMEALLMATDSNAPVHYALNGMGEAENYHTVLLRSGKRQLSLHMDSNRDFEEWWGIINWTIHSSRSGIDRFQSLIQSHSMTPPPTLTPIN